MSMWRGTIERFSLWRVGAVVAAGLAGLLARSPAVAGPSGRPAFRVDYPFPTADKPQSKLWYAGERWWALLPRSSGPSLWERSPSGWREHAEVAEQLRGVPGRADVWYDSVGVTAVAVADRLLAVVRLTAVSGPAASWQARVLARIASPVSDMIETVTVARDNAGTWWVAAPIQGRAFVWHSNDGVIWSTAQQVAAGLHVDDLCLVTPLPDGVAVIWSDQKREAVRMRLHRSAAEPAAWEPPVTIESGGRTADDHLHATLTADGRVWVATKNSVDAPGRPQLVLRVRQPDGVWENYPYAPLSAEQAPSRPIVLGTTESGRVLLGHVVYGSGPVRHDRIVFGWADPQSPTVIVEERAVIVPEDSEARVNDITGPKAAFTAHQPWIVLASDGQGRVYEADLRAGTR